jgi:hypothetical protein
MNVETVIVEFDVVPRDSVSSAPRRQFFALTKSTLTGLLWRCK